MRRELEMRQAQVSEVLARLERFFDTAGPPNLVSLGELRVAFQRLLSEHMAFRENLYRRLRAAGVHYVDRAIGRSRTASVSLQVAYRFHLFDWKADAIARDWPGYVAASRVLLARVRLFAEADQAHLNPLIDQLIGDPTIPPAASDTAAAMRQVLKRFDAPHAVE